jgi:hypothetical protein
MSALCHKLPFAPQQISPLLDYSICACEKRGRHSQAERFGGLEVDDQLVFGRRLHWQFGRLLAFEDAIDTPVWRYASAMLARSSSP